VPTYQYACTECGHAFDQVQSFTDDALTECPVCSGRLRKVYNAVGVVFKGSGFYRNDSRSATSGAPASGSSDAKSDSKSETKSDTKSESKSEAKSDSKSEKKSDAKPAASSSASSTS
jgi:putative FmdB family regulatory protein